jgi:hypothetical protein
MERRKFTREFKRLRLCAWVVSRLGSVQTLSHIWFGLSGARNWLTQ